MTWKFIYTYRERCKTGPAHNRCWKWSPFSINNIVFIDNILGPVEPKISLPCAQQPSNFRILSHLNSVRAIQFALRSILIIFSHLWLILPTYYILQTSLAGPSVLPCQSHAPSYDQPTHICSHKVWQGQFVHIDALQTFLLPSPNARLVLSDVVSLPWPDLT